MCGRYAFFQKPSEVRRQLQESQMPVDEAPEDDAVRQSYNFAPGYYGLVYRADVPDYGAGPRKVQEDEEELEPEQDPEIQSSEEHDATRYKLQAMKWGLVPFWTKRNPDYSTIMRTINCRDDSLIDNRGMWTSMKKRKRCIVVCHGFYEWLKKNNGKERIPHYVKRKDNKLLCLAGLWDVVKYEDSEEKNYTYSIITTDPNKQLKFLHDRMPVILNPGSEAIRTWLDPNKYEWSKDLQSLLKPFDGELEIYPVNKDVGKVGNDSPSFIIPIDSSENKRNIANFFNKPGHKLSKVDKSNGASEENDCNKEDKLTSPPIKIKTEEDVVSENSETNAPLLFSPPSNGNKLGMKRELSPTGVESGKADSESSPKVAKLSQSGSPSRPKAGRKMYSATSNGSISKSGSPSKMADGSQKITSFFTKKGG